MKSLKLFLLTSVIIFTGCDLDENPPFLDDTIYQDSQTIIGARDGMFQAITTYNTQERRLYVENLYGGLMQTGKGGRTTATDQVSLNALNPGYHNDAAFLWLSLIHI